MQVGPIKGPARGCVHLRITYTYTRQPRAGIGDRALQSCTPYILCSLVGTYAPCCVHFRERSGCVPVRAWVGATLRSGRVAWLGAGAGGAGARRGEVKPGAILG